MTMSRTAPNTSSVRMPERRPMSAKMRPDLAPGDHADADHEAPVMGPGRGPAGGELAGDREESQQPGDDEGRPRRGVRGIEQPQVHRRADAHEEDRREDRGHRLHFPLDDIELVGAGQDESGGEGADDEGGSGHGGRRRQAQGEGHREDGKHETHPHPDHQVEHAGQQEPSGDDRHEEKAHRDTEGLRDAEAGHDPTGRDTGDDAQDDQSQDIVDDRRSNDDPGLLTGHPSEVGEHAGGDTHRGGGERRADEDGLIRDAGGGRLTGVGQIGPVSVAEGKRHRDADQRHRQRRGSDPEHLPEVGLESDLEEEQDDAQLGEQMDDVGRDTGGGNDAEGARAQKHSRDELPEHGRLPDQLGQLAKELGAHEHRGEGEKEPG